jgi:tetratricopeptide (TPR) repeat protein
VKTLDAENSRDVRYRLANALHQVANLRGQALWQFETARGLYVESRELMQKLFEERPEVGDVGHSLARILNDAAFLEGRENKIDAARALYEESLNVLTRVEANNPDVPHYRQLRAELLHWLGSLRHPLLDDFVPDKDMAQLEEAVAIGRRLVEQFPQEVDRQVALARYESSLGTAYDTRGREKDAKAQFDHAIGLLNDVSRQTGDIVDTLYALAELQYSMAEKLAVAERRDEALKMLDDAEVNLNRLAILAPRFREAHLSLANLYIERSNVLEQEGRLVQGIKELDRLTAKSAELEELASAEWMQGALKALLGVAKVQRWSFLVQIRDGSIKRLADRGLYQFAGVEAAALPSLSGEASDHYVAATALAYAAKAASKDEKLSADARQSLVEPLAADAVNQLTLAWEKGLLRRKSSGFGGLFSSAPTLRDVQRGEEFETLRDREDFAALVRRIETEEPPKKPSAKTPTATEK